MLRLGGGPIFAILVCSFDEIDDALRYRVRPVVERGEWGFGGAAALIERSTESNSLGHRFLKSTEAGLIYVFARLGEFGVAVADPAKRKGELPRRNAFLGQFLSQ